MTSRRTRERMVARLREHGIQNEVVLRAMAEMPRHLFVDDAWASHAYDDTALPIGFNQTISQPYIVARMTEILLEHCRRPPARVLEVGTGSGYQTAILARLARQVYTIERIQALQTLARQRLTELELFNVHFKHRDGAAGWIDHAPYDGILVTAAPASVPQALTEQLTRGGVMVLPVGTHQAQDLHKVTRRDTRYLVERLEPVVFVPFLPGKE